MPEKTSVKYPLVDTIIAKAAACNKQMHCLEDGPNCRVGAALNETILIVDCLDKDASCAFYQASKSSVGSNGRGICHCPVRLALRNKFGL